MAANANAQPAVDPGLGIPLDWLAVIMDWSTRGKVTKPRFDTAHSRYPGVIIELC